jgi:prepilin-type N-terminal cleavage/methylation domain-containing protein
MINLLKPVKRKQKGFTLIEVIMFIVIISISAAVILSSLQMILKTNHTAQENATAVQAASRCLEWYWGQNQMNGYSSVSCPSTTVPSFCSVPTGFSMAVNVVCTTSTTKTITATVSGKGTSSLSLLIADDGT